MKTKAYMVFGVIVLAFMVQAHYEGGGGDVDEVKNVPKSVRDNPGSYRSSYGHGRVYTGGK